MNIKKGDTVKILIGKDRGKSGKIFQILQKDGKNTRAVVEGLNLKYKHLRARNEREKGQKIMFPAPVNISNLMLVCPKCGKATRVGYKVTTEKTEIKKEKKQRVCKKCQAII